MMTTDQLRRAFLDFFESKSHKIVPSDSLIPADDPTVLFTSAGMNQFKKQFLGEVGDFRRAATVQKCLRTDDLDKVGKTASHHTFFEMLGNFSFGDYFKKEAIAWAWEFMTEILKVKEDNLWASVYKDDDEAYNIWKNEIKIPARKIVKLGDKDNFWPANAIIDGPNGPCGPCSEIFYDWGKSAGCGAPNCSPACGCGRFVEVWNLVFTQFNRISANKLEPLPQKNIDTGMGLERISSVLQGVKTNFEIDIFAPIIKEIVSSIKYQVSSKEALYAIADHVRAAVFAISDGVMPSNEERGYVVRKIIRQAFFKAIASGNKRPFLYKIVPVVCGLMKAPYPELEARREDIALVIKAEEEKFCQTLEEGERMLSEMKGLSGRKGLSAEEAFKLHDTYGYPLDLLKEQGIKFDQGAVDKLLEKQRLQSRGASKLSGDVFGALASKIDFKSEFLGYDTEKASVNVLAVTEDSEGIKIILDRTPFYAESGGQIGDKGKITSSSASAEVYDTRKLNQAIAHYALITKGEFIAGDKVTATVDSSRRLDISRNHTATHLLQAALRKVLGEHVRQQGSLVSDKYLRFDFTHFKALTGEELSRVEELVNEYVRANEKVVKRVMPQDAARKEGALAFFADKYQDDVRVVSVGGYSKELCGGIHLDNTGSIGLFRIISETSVASGIRRIEAITGAQAYKKSQEEDEIIKGLAKQLKVTPDKLRDEIDSKLKYIKQLDKALTGAYLKLFETSVPEILEGVKLVKGIKLLVVDLKSPDMQYMRLALDKLKNKASAPYAIFLFAKIDGKGVFCLNLSQDLKAKGYDAQKITGSLGLRGGGRAEAVQGGMENKGWPDRTENWEELFSAPEKLRGAIGDLL